MRLACVLAAVLAGASGCDFDPSAAGPDAAPGEDPDGDGLPNVADNCDDTANPDQRDDDGDGAGDICDNCPHVANADQANAGETGAGGVRDGAGDACDPFPTVGGNDIVMFETFAGSLDGWGQTGNGLWTTADGALTQSRNDVISTLYVGAPMPGAVVDTTATLISGRGAVTGGFGFGPVSNFYPSILHGTGFACDLLDRDGEPFGAAIDYLDSSTFQTLDRAAGTDTDLTGQRLAMRVMANISGSVQSCNITSAGGIDLVATGNDDRGDSGRIALRTFNAAVRFDHVVVFSIAP